MVTPAKWETMMLEPLTEIERGILEYLIGYLRHHTYQPSLREIGRHFGLRSTKTTSEYLQGLVDKGWIERDPARSRGIRIIGLELETNAVSIPMLTEAGFTRTPRESNSGHHLTLDRSLAGSTRAAYLPMPDDSLAHLGIHARDLLLLEPVAPEDLEPGDVVVTSLADDLYIHAWEEPPLVLDPPIGRVNSIIRQLRTPSALTPVPNAFAADVHTTLT